MEFYPAKTDWDRIRQESVGQPVTSKLLYSCTTRTVAAAPDCGSVNFALAETFDSLQRFLSKEVRYAVGNLVACISTGDTQDFPRPAQAKIEVEMLIVYSLEVARSVHMKYLAMPAEQIRREIQDAWLQVFQAEIAPEWQKYWNHADDLFDYLQSWHAAIAECVAEGKGFSIYGE